MFMIRSFADKESASLWQTGTGRRLPRELHGLMRMKLVMIDAAVDVGDLSSPPGTRLKKLGGKRKEDWAIRVNDQWRITFRWIAGQPERVSIEDYH
jgi:proteic killer suppression protein